jgi:hypothetical protein
LKLYDGIFRIRLEILMTVGEVALDAYDFQTLMNLNDFSASMLK